MDKGLFEKEIFIEDDDDFLDFLEIHFNIKNVDDLTLITNLQSLKGINKYKKQYLMARLDKIIESNDLIPVFAILTTIFLASLFNYGSFIKEIIPNNTLALVVVIGVYLFFLYVWVRPLAESKGKKAKAKYYITLFKDI